MSEPSKGSAKRKPEAANDVSQLAGASQALKKPNTASDASQLAGKVRFRSWWELLEHDMRDFKKRCYWDLIDKEAPAKKAKTAASQSSSASQPVWRVRILFVDAGCIAESLQACLIPDHRPELSADDILGAAEELEASIIIGSDFPIDEAPAADCKMWDSCKSTMQHTRSHGDYAPTSWHCWWNYDAWTVTSFSSIPLSTSPQDLQHQSQYLRCLNRPIECWVICIFDIDHQSIKCLVFYNIQIMGQKRGQTIFSQDVICFNFDIIPTHMWDF